MTRLRPKDMIIDSKKGDIVMKKKKIFAICDLEEAYVVRLADYLNTKGMLPYQVLAFTNLESLGRYAQDNEIEILLISTDAMSDEVREMNVRRVIILAEGEEPGLDQEAVIRKYQDSDSIARQVLSFAGDSKAVDMPPGCRIFAVWSPVARCGKTLFALTLAQAAGEEGRALYLNLEDYSGFEPLFRTTYRSDTADLVHASRDRTQNLAALLESAVQTFGSLDIVPPAFFPDDIRDIRPGEWLEFIAATAAAGDYRTIVLDIGSQMQDAADLLERCTRCYVPILADPMSRAKISQFDRNMKALGKDVLLSSMVRIYLPEVEVRSSGAALLDDLAYGRMGQFARRLLEEEAQRAA